MRSFHADGCRMRLVWQAIAYVGASAFVVWKMWALFVQPVLDERDRGAPPFGSKRWHWPAVAFLGLLVVYSIILLRFVEDPR